ncbi:MAG: hypothetical protein H7282_10950 [Cytophagaceae bacterium]|nr:hypothetical protein [Cytophagaceae bacterium]
MSYYMQPGIGHFLSGHRSLLANDLDDFGIGSTLFIYAITRMSAAMNQSQAFSEYQYPI